MSPKQIVRAFTIAFAFATIAQAGDITLLGQNRAVEAWSAVRDEKFSSDIVSEHKTELAMGLEPFDRSVSTQVMVHASSASHSAWQSSTIESGQLTAIGWAKGGSSDLIGSTPAGHFGLSHYEVSFRVNQPTAILLTGLVGHDWIYPYAVPWGGLSQVTLTGPEGVVVDHATPSGWIGYYLEPLSLPYSDELELAPGDYTLRAFSRAAAKADSSIHSGYSVTMTWTQVPEPSFLLIALLPTVLTLRRHRGNRHTSIA